MWEERGKGLNYFSSSKLSSDLASEGIDSGNRKIKKLLLPFKNCSQNKLIVYIFRNFETFSNGSRRENGATRSLDSPRMFGGSIDGEDCLLQEFSEFSLETRKEGISPLRLERAINVNNLSLRRFRGL